MAKFTYYGHSTFLVDLQGVKLLFDPFITPNEMAAHVDPTKIEADYLLLSHGHADHVADAVAIAKRTGAQVISNFEIITWLQNQGVEKGSGMNHGGTQHVDFGSIKYVNAVHSSSLPDGSYGGNPGGFLIKTPSFCFYYSGDTALTWDMKLIAEECSLDLAILCIGDHFTMGIEDAVKAAQFVNCSKIMGMHYDTFPPIHIDHEQAKTAFQKAGKELFLLPIGESLEF